jgi:hypothetical protein
MGMDFSAFPSDLWMVHWIEGKGEIEYQTADGKNLNGLRESFFDVTPYVPLFKQFLNKIPGLTLDQAKKVQIDLIKQLFESKRQMPYHHPIAAGDYWWDATDGSLFASTAGGLQSTTTKLNEVIDRLNGLIPNINGTIVNNVNTNVAVFNSNVSAINADFGNLATEINTDIVNIGNQTIAHINTTVLGANEGGGGGGANNINNKLVSTFFGGSTPITAAAPGLAGNIAHNAYSFGSINAYSITGVESNIPSLSWSNVGHVTPANAQWIPIGSSTPVNVTPDEQTAILNGIAARTQDLFIIKNTKISEVNALTTIPDVIAYDVLADWPDLPAPPGFKLDAPLTFGGGLTVIGTPSGGGDFPEAPVDGKTYGRRNMAWNPALALSNDVLDGGNF